MADANCRTLREAATLALEALILNNKEWKAFADSGDAGFWLAEDQGHYMQTADASAALSAALAQPAPVERQPLTDEALKRMIDAIWEDDATEGGRTIGMISTQLARAIEAAHNIKAAA